MSAQVWYAAYGSNLSRSRFEVYLRGGRPAGAGHDYPGCRDPSAPAEDRPHELEGALAFAGSSSTWGGGVATLNIGADGHALARLYLVTAEQFADVVAQENWMDPGEVVLPGDLAAEHDLGAERVYGLVRRAGTLDGRPVLTVTQHAGVRPAAPSPAYLHHIAEGLRETHALDDAAIASYLAAAPGVSGVLSQADVFAAVGPPS